MICWLNVLSWSCMKVIRSGRTYRFFFTSSLSFSTLFNRVASFSVVIIILGEGIAANVSLMS